MTFEAKTSLMAAVLMVGAIFTMPTVTIAQEPDTCWRCESPTSGQTGECFDGWPSGYLECESTIQGCELTHPDCSEKTEDIQDALQIHADELLMLAGGDGVVRAHAPITERLYMAWDCTGEVVSVRLMAASGLLVPLPPEIWSEKYTLARLAETRSETSKRDANGGS